MAGTLKLTDPGTRYGLEWNGKGDTRSALVWTSPFAIYDATYIFRVYPRKKTAPSNGFPNNYWTTFFWGNNGRFDWDSGNGNTYYGAHPYPAGGGGAPNGTQGWEISAYGTDYGVNDWSPFVECTWNRWYTQSFRVWRTSSTTTNHEFYYDWPDTNKVITVQIVDAGWADTNPPSPCITMGQAPDYLGQSWGGYDGWEEFNGVIRGIQIYSDLLSLTEIAEEIASPQSSTTGSSACWYLNLNPKPTDVADKKSGGTPHNPSWDGSAAAQWSG